MNDFKRVFLLGWATGMFVGGLMFLIMAAFAMTCAGCYQDVPGPVTVRTVHVHDKVPCLTMPPPPVPNVQCGAIPFDDCLAITAAAWSDYGHRMDQWTRMYAWPACQQGDAE